MPNSQFDEKAPLYFGMKIQSTYTPGTLNSFAGPGKSDYRFDVWIVTNTDTVDANLTVYLNDGTTDYVVGSLTVPAGSGTGATLPVDILHVLFGDTFHYLNVPQGNNVKVSLAAAPASGKIVTLFAMGGGI